MALAAVQGLNEKLETKVKALQLENEELLDRLERLESKVEALSAR